MSPTTLSAFLARLGLCCALALPLQARADELPVDLELVLGVDVSWSMDLDEQRLQRAGYAEAFRNAQVIRAILEGGYGRIAVIYFEWAGASLQRLITPWTVIESQADAEAFADRLSGSPPGRMERTSISGALTAGRAMFDGNGFAGLRRVIDVSGDGPNNEGPPVVDARDAVVAEGITINGLPLMLKEPDLSYGIVDLDLYYQNCVIGGPNAFIVTVREPDEFAEAVRRKLILEIAGRRSHLQQAQFEAPTEADDEDVDCLVGERLWQRRRGFMDDR